MWYCGIPVLLWSSPGPTHAQQCCGWGVWLFVHHLAALHPRCSSPHSHPGSRVSAAQAGTGTVCAETWRSSKRTTESSVVVLGDRPKYDILHHHECSDGLVAAGTAFAGSPGTGLHLLGTLLVVHWWGFRWFFRCLIFFLPTILLILGRVFTLFCSRLCIWRLKMFCR